MQRTARRVPNPTIQVRFLTASPIFGTSMGYLDSSDAALIALTRQRRAERAARKPTLYFRIQASNVNDRRKKITAAEAHPNPQHTFWQSRKRVRPLAGIGCPGSEHPRSPFWGMFKAQDGCCYLCGWAFREDHWVTEDHVTPRSRGGANRHNVALAHSGCNTWKGNREPYPCELISLAAINARLEWAAWERASDAARRPPPPSPTLQDSTPSALQAAWHEPCPPAADGPPELPDEGDAPLRAATGC